jgi:AcrR family transcriptional regulator
MPAVTAKRAAAGTEGRSRGDRTREQILDAAEQLFAERGIDTPSLNEINSRADQRNKTSLQYHFGGRDGLLEALLRRHGPWFRRVQERLLAELIASDRMTDVRALVELQILPLAEYSQLGPSQRCYIRIWAQILASPQVRLDELRFTLDEPGQTLAGRQLVTLMAADMPRELAIERLTGMMQSAVHLIADRAVLEDTVERRRTVVAMPIFAANLVDMVSAALTAPVTDATRTALAQRPRRKDR